MSRQACKLGHDQFYIVPILSRLYTGWAIKTTIFRSLQLGSFSSPLWGPRRNIHWKVHSGLPISVNWTFLLVATADALRANMWLWFGSRPPWLTDTHTDRQLLSACTVSSASWAKQAVLFSSPTVMNIYHLQYQVFLSLMITKGKTAINENKTFLLTITVTITKFPENKFFSLKISI